jgi:hypothetical protein
MNFSQLALNKIQISLKPCSPCGQLTVFSAQAGFHDRGACHLMPVQGGKATVDIQEKLQSVLNTIWPKPPLSVCHGLHVTSGEVSWFSLRTRRMP